jgi:UDP-N-acetylglucosamine 4-epimerase
LAATAENKEAKNQVYNVAVGDRTSLNQLCHFIQEILSEHVKSLKETRLIYREFRAGDVRHSLADITKARALLGYSPTHRLYEGLKEAMKWYTQQLNTIE